MQKIVVTLPEWPRMMGYVVFVREYATTTSNIQRLLKTILLVMVKNHPFFPSTFPHPFPISLHPYTGRPRALLWDARYRHAILCPFSYFRNPNFENLISILIHHLAPDSPPSLHKRTIAIFERSKTPFYE